MFTSNKSRLSNTETVCHGVKKDFCISYTLRAETISLSNNLAHSLMRKKKREAIGARIFYTR